jgi:hypothetical protein
MISQETSLMIRHFVKEGLSKAEVARRFGVCRQTVYNHMNREGPYVKPRKRRASKLDPYKDTLTVLTPCAVSQGSAVRGADKSTWSPFHVRQGTSAPPATPSAGKPGASG